MFRLFLISELIILFLFTTVPEVQGAIDFQESKNIEIDTIPETAREDTTFRTSISPFVELLGKGFFSLNADFRLKKHFAFSFGLQPLEVVCPDLMFYYLTGELKSLEAGGGLSVAMTENMDVGAVFIHGVIGYRYQKKKGLFFRAGFTPLYVISFNSEDKKNRLLPFIGLSFGYSF